MIIITTGKTIGFFAVDYLGGKCFNCKYDRYTGALDIHHLDPAIKIKISSP
jgi:hypothetical protein